MSKNMFFTGQPVFSQLLSLIPRRTLTSVAKKHRSDRYYKRFFFFDHVVSMLVCSFHGCTSLRELTTGMQVYASRLSHFGIVNPPRRSTLAEANMNRSAAAFEDLFHRLFQELSKFSPDSRNNNSINKLFLIDSTTITLFKNIMKGAGNATISGRKKGGVKAHVVLDAGMDTPSFVRITEARMNDKTFLKNINLPVGGVAVFDKGYNDYNEYKRMTIDGIIWVTLINKAAVYREESCSLITKEEHDEGILSDSTITLGNPATKSKTPLQTVRLIKYKNPQTKKYLEFLTNDLERPALEVAQLYKQRWQIETFFKRLKQNMPVKYFLGDNENAIKIQLWCALIADLLIKIVFDKIAMKTKRKWSFANLAGLIRLHLGTYVDLRKFLANPDLALQKYKPPEIQYSLILK